MHPVSPSVDLLAPPGRFVAASRLYVNLHRYQLLLRKYWWPLAIVVVATLGPILALTLTSPRAYRSDARMWLTGKLDLSEGRLYTEELVNFLGTQADLLRSRPIQERALARVQQQLPAGSLKPLPGMLDVVRGWFSPSARARFRDTAFPFRLKVTESSKSSFLELVAQGTEPKSTQMYLDAVMSEYLKFKRENREQASDRAVASLAKNVSQLAGELKAEQEKMYAFQMSNNVVFLQEQGSGAGSYLALLNRQLATLRTELDLLQTIDPEHWLELGARTSSGGKESEPPPGESPAEQRLAGLAGPRADLLRATEQAQLLKAQREQLSKVLQPMHPKIIKLDQDIGVQEQLAAIARDEIRRQLVARREALELEVQNLQKTFNDWDHKALQASRKIVDYDRLRQDVLRTQAAYDKLLSVISTVDLGKSVDQENVSVLEAASPAVPVHKFIRNVGLGVLLMLILGGGLFWMLARFDDRFASSTELAEEMPERVLGQVVEIRLSKPESQLKPEVLSSQGFEFLESFRNIRSALWFMGENGNRPKTILVTSSLPEEGKSTVALYLAATMAKANARVLLIDGDLRRAKLHRYLGVPSSPGLAELLTQEKSPEAAIATTFLPGLSFMPAGAPSVDPGELVLGRRLIAVLGEVRSQFDYVIVDSPPVLAADDAAVMAPGVDGVLFIVRGAFTSARMTREALETLRERHAHVLGLIFNRAVSTPFEDRPYHRYRNQYRWQTA